MNEGNLRLYHEHPNMPGSEGCFKDEGSSANPGGESPRGFPWPSVHRPEHEKVKDKHGNHWNDSNIPESIPTLMHA